MTRLNLSPQGWLDLEHFEGCVLKAYQDVVGYWTIGIGSRFHPDGSDVKKGDIITRQQAEQYVQHFLDNEENKIASVLTTTVSQRQWDAMVCLTYNIGVGGFLHSSVLKSINIKPGISNVTNIVHNWKKWDQAGGRINNDLLQRRNEELVIYFEGQMTLSQIRHII